jgi:hypothetical protein
MKLTTFRVLFSCVALMATAINSYAASLAFVGFNADGTDGYSLATFDDIPTGTVINFTDDEWNGSVFTDSNEADWSWTATSEVPAGTVINFVDMANIYSGSPAASASIGTVAGVSVGSNNAGYSNSGEVVYAFSGTRAAPTFLAAISSASAGSFDFGGLSGAQAIQLLVNSDGAKYIGPRSSETQLADYLPLIAGYPVNWSDVGNGDGDNNFDPTPFSTVPEPATCVLSVMCLLLTAMRRK